VCGRRYEVDVNAASNSVGVVAFGAEFSPHPSRILEDLMSWFLGPAGIVIDWPLDERTLHGSAEREGQRAEVRKQIRDTAGLGRVTAGLTAHSFMAST
jgi:hypothetical protein